jgi:hypothetical protein
VSPFLFLLHIFSSSIYCSTPNTCRLLSFSHSSFSLSPSPAAHPTTLPRKIPQQTKPTSRKINPTKSNQTNQKKEDKKRKIKRKKKKRGNWACTSERGEGIGGREEATRKRKKKKEK